MRVLPIFRARDAKADVARSGNQRTNDECYELFKKGNAILIFPEGSAYPEKNLRGLKRGTANIAIDMAQRSNHALDLYIVPTALNYSTFGTMRRTIHIHYGKPIRIQDFKDRIEANDKSLSLEITQEIETTLETCVVKTKGEYTEEKECLHQIMINANQNNLSYMTKGPWVGDIRKANTILSEQANVINDYKKELDQSGILDSNVNENSFDYISFLIALFTFAISLPVYIVWLVIFKVVVYYGNKKIKNPIFIDSVIIGSAMVFSLFLSIVVFVFFLNTTPSWWPIVFTVASLYGALCWFRMVDEIPFLWKQLKWLGLSDSVKQKIQNKRKAVWNIIAND